VKSRLDQYSAGVAQTVATEIGEVIRNTENEN
jgi:hypothetical protein